MGSRFEESEMSLKHIVVKELEQGVDDPITAH